MRVKMGGVRVCIGNRLVACFEPLFSQESMCVRLEGWVVAFEGFRRGSFLSRWQLLGVCCILSALLEHRVTYFSIETKAYPISSFAKSEKIIVTFLLRNQVKIMNLHFLVECVLCYTNFCARLEVVEIMWGDAGGIFSQVTPLPTFAQLLLSNCFSNMTDWGCLA